MPWIEQEPPLAEADRQKQLDAMTRRIDELEWRVLLLEGGAVRAAGRDPQSPLDDEIPF